MIQKQNMRGLPKNCSQYILNGFLSLGQETANHSPYAKSALLSFLFLTKIHWHSGASQVVPVVKSPPANAEDVRDMGLISGSGRSCEEEHRNPFHTLASRIPWTEEPGGLQYMRSQRVRHDGSNLAAASIHRHPPSLIHGLWQLYGPLQKKGLPTTNIEKKFARR